ncbi:hypothetical protein BU14_0144s0023 [Porphyra umbilicalis]|uniref:Cytochrome c oxidase assembly factor 5 n=1 Tax=Porphyra umbilicalis TaxID=2786 RepID=A0A1X6P9H3_PORUM|nr:hypothetical protein BU14_0144s0023 [Porphyra umbilicalis]|eukprot:OSX77559.1 hypothetical protein BU14_0144s0023 [Porphyra umbilicalis]
MSKSCTGLFDDMVRCLSDSPCVRQHPTPAEALRDCARAEADGVADTCKAVIAAYATCRKSQLNMRRRIRGMPGY